jgi:hypothetical protein
MNEYQDNTNLELSPELIEFFCEIYAKDHNIMLPTDNGYNCIDVHLTYITLIESWAKSKSGSKTNDDIDFFSPYSTIKDNLFDDWAESIGLYEYIWDNIEEIEDAFNKFNTNDQDIEIEICI